MSKDKRAEIVEAMARELLGRVNAPEQEVYRVAGDLADIALKAAAGAVCDGCRKELPLNENGYHAQGWYTTPCHADAILALTKEGTKG